MQSASVQVTSSLQRAANSSRLPAKVDKEADTVLPNHSCKLPSMIHVHCTRKLLTCLPIRESGVLPNRFGRADTDLNPLRDWHANVVTVQRRKWVLFVHDATRFPVMVKGLLKADFAALADYFEDSLMNTLLKCGAEERHMNAALACLADLVCDTECDRSVQGTMNQMLQSFRWMLEYENVDPEIVSAYRTGAWLADQPITIRKSRETTWPKDAMLGLLDSIGEPPGIGKA